MAWSSASRSVSFAACLPACRCTKQKWSRKVSKRNSQREPKRQRDQRILILAPTGRDAELTARFLADASLMPHVCITVDEVCGQLKLGAGVVLLTEESLTTRSLGSLTRTLNAQPRW